MTLLAMPFLALLLAPPEAPAAQAGADVLWLGKVELSLGATQEETKAKLEKHYVLKPAPATRSFFVYEKAGADVGRSLGAVEFEENRLTSITRERWPKGQGRAIDLAKALSDVLADLVKEGRTSCTIEADNASPAMQVATIRCDRKQVSLVIVKTDAETKLVVTEMLR